jgi:hypothetical protein
MRSTPTTCTIANCGGLHCARGLCKNHYERFQKTNKLEAAPPTTRPRSSIGDPCKTCNKTIEKRSCLGMCRNCYNRYRKSRPDAPRCSVHGCAASSIARELCQKHYLRLRRNGSPDKITRREPGSGCISRGYVYLAGVLAHRTKTSSMLGRELYPEETVHHRNGNKSDNSIGPCVTSSACVCLDGPHNLELWAKSQPAGQRICDLVSWAQEILYRYR